MRWFKKKMNKTFAVGTDRNHEDLLPWWYYNIKKYSPKPDITIADLGMSPRMREWSQEHSDTFLEYDINEGRAWFYKPQIMLDAPYEYVCWVDSDCEVMKPIDDVFNYPTDTQIALSLDIIRMGLNEVPQTTSTPVWATGVNCSKGKSDILKYWAFRCNHSTNRGDQEELLQMVREAPSLNSQIVQLPLIYQWLRLSLANGYDNPNKKIVHWTGPTGKNHIRTNLMP